MVSKYIYTKVYIIGSGQLAFGCAEIVKKYISNIKVFELKVTESTVLEKLCGKNEIPYQMISSKELTQILMSEEESTLIVSAASIYLVPETVIQKKNFLIINWHNALLPKHKGRNAEVWAIYNGDDVTGVTWHLITKDIDAGAIIRQEMISIDEKTTAMSLYREQMALGEKMFCEFCEAMLKGQYKTEPQKIESDSQIHYSKDVPNKGVLDLDWEIEKILCFLRSMDYGSLLLMGKMKLIYSGVQYEFYRYNIKYTDECLMQRAIMMEDGRLTIKENNTVIIIKGLQEIG